MMCSALLQWCYVKSNSHLIKIIRYDNNKKSLIHNICHSAGLISESSSSFISKYIDESFIVKLRVYEIVLQ